MEKLIFLLFLCGLCLVHSCDNFQNDNLVFLTHSAKSCEGRLLPSRGHKKQVVETFNEFTRFTFQWESSLLENSECRIQINAVHQEAAKWNLWALKMLDASAKLPSGILSGNLNQYGDFDECLSVKGHSQNRSIRGKYCLANIGIKFGKNETSERINKLDAAIHSHWIVHNEYNDQGHRIPKFETFNVGICIPASCAPQEIEAAFSKELNKLSRNGFVNFEVSIDDEVCYVEKENKYSLDKLLVWFMFSLVVVLVILGTLIETNKFQVNNIKFVRIVTCFSLKRNLSLLLNTSSPQDDIQCLHGARFLNAVALLLSHKQIAMLFSATLNRTEMSESVSKGWTMIGRAAILYTDSFIFFSGLLISYSIIKDLDTKRIMNFKGKLVSRIVRLLPNLMGVILFCTYIMNDMGSGPQWGLVVGKYTDLCKKYMWRNFLFIHNYFGFENMCLTHTHQLGIDMQLFLVSPIFVYAIWKMPKLGTFFATAVAVGSTWLRYDKTYKGNLSTILYYGISVERLWTTANTSYIIPTHRSTVYIMGIMVGYYLRRGGRNLTLTFLQATIGWIMAIAAGLLAVFGQYQTAYKEYVYDVTDAARFNSFAPILWTIFVSWCVICCVNGYAGKFNDFLSWKYFSIFTKISYAVYLTQFPVFFYNVGTERVAQYYKGFHSLFDVEELSVIFIVSIVLTLTFDIPFQELKKILLPRQPNINKKEGTTSERTETSDNQLQKGRIRLQSYGT